MTRPKPYRIAFRRCLWSPWAVYWRGKPIAAFSNTADAVDFCHDHASQIRGAI